MRSVLRAAAACAVVASVVTTTSPRPRALAGPYDALAPGQWMELPGPAPPVDADLDGIADAWELMHGLNPANPLDSALLDASGYAHIEVYLNEVAQTLTGQAPTPPGTPAPPTNLRITP